MSPRSVLHRWASLPVIVALLFATSTVAAAVGGTTATGPAQVPLAVQLVSAQTPHASGHQPDVRFDARGGPGTVAPDLAAFAWLPARAGTAAAAWWHRRQDAGGHRAQARRETYQGRGPPGRRAADVPS